MLGNILDDIKEVTQWGHEYTTLDFELNINGVKCVDRYCCRKINNLFVCVIFSAKESGDFDKMMQAFSKYGKAATEMPEESVKPEGDHMYVDDIKTARNAALIKKAEQYANIAKTKAQLEYGTDASNYRWRNIYNYPVLQNSKGSGYHNSPEP